jgi:hypothetical protein
VNAALERVLVAEAAAIRGGRDLPFGVSLLAVFRRPVHTGARQI